MYLILVDINISCLTNQMNHVVLSVMMKVMFVNLCKSNASSVDI